MTFFTPTFQKSVAKVAEELGLMVTTSNQQMKNGTIELTDPVASTDSYRLTYTMHDSGWVSRRKVFVGRRSNRRGLGDLLNERVMTKSGKGYRCRATANEQIGLLVRGVIRYR